MRKTLRCGRPSTRSELARWYAEALEEQESSGLSVAEFAEEIGVSPATLYEWRRRLSVGVTERQRSRSPFGLVEVAVDTDRASTDDGPFVVCVGKGRRIEVPGRFAEAGLRRLVQVLESC